MRIKINILVINKKCQRLALAGKYKGDINMIVLLYHIYIFVKVKKGGETMNKTKMAIIAGIVLCVIVGCIAGGVFN